jgi:hypothetical protein
VSLCKRNPRPSPRLESRDGWSQRHSSAAAARARDIAGRATNRCARRAKRTATRRATAGGRDSTSSRASAVSGGPRRCGGVRVGAANRDRDCQRRDPRDSRDRGSGSRHRRLLPGIHARWQVTRLSRPGGVRELKAQSAYAVTRDERLSRQCVAIFGSTMPIALHECGPIPDPAQLQSTSTKWVLFNVWTSPYYQSPSNSVAHLQAVYASDYVITLDEMPGF